MRTSRLKSRLAPATLLLATMAVSACGGDTASEQPDGIADVVPDPGVSGAPAALRPQPEEPQQPAGPPVDGLPVSFDRVWAAWEGDFEGMVERRFIRAVVPYGGYHFFYQDGRPRGATYEFVQRFEKYLNEMLDRRSLKVHVVMIPVGRDELIPALLEGHADLVAADLTTTGMRAEQVAFTRPTLEGINEVIVTGPESPVLGELADLSGQSVTVRASSSYFDHLQRLSERLAGQGLAPIDIVVADELLEAEDLLEMLNAGLVSLTVMDDYKAEFWAGVFPDITVRDDLVIHEQGAIAWAMRKESTAFMAIVNRFLKEYGKGTMIGNDTYNRYLADATRVRCTRSPGARHQLDGLVSVFRKYGDDYGFDWLMLAAQAYQESGLRQDRVSAAGAVGLMQIKPATAADRNVDVGNIDTVDGNVHAGAKYLRFVADRYFDTPEMDDLTQWIFSLAAYNAGPARVASLRREAEEAGYDPNLWFDNVEIIAARRIGRETPDYVSNVFKYYVGYELAAARGALREERYGDELEACSSDLQATSG